MLFTVFTPVLNRRDTIGRVWDSLRAQTCRDFEWVVVDDGSTDGGRRLRLMRDIPARYFFNRWHLRANLDYLKHDRKALLKTIVAAVASGLLAGPRVRKALAAFPAPPSRPGQARKEMRSC